MIASEEGCHFAAIVNVSCLESKEKKLAPSG